ncbi:MAG: hypothetical protein A2297_10305 [Elusimicrobia bacterium RIFOXYB2_FULL_48_7]|nr:MAG: hypothetical protein A2297_10305 [Elusimicrobia bacterium RIFOXYB2_FULL_48_7]
MTTKLVAIGGCHIEVDSEALAIHREIVRLTGKKRPKLLFVTTASSTPEEYFTLVPECFGWKLGCKIDFLLFPKWVTKEMIRKQILGADMIYVSGGNSLKMLKIWKRHGVDKLMKQAYQKGIVISGVSAGALCWFNYANSDSMKFYNRKNKMIKLHGLNLIKAFFCPHYSSQKERASSLKIMMKNMPIVAIACDDSCAIEIINDKYRIICAKKSANAYKVFWKNGEYHRELILKRKSFAPLGPLLAK